jgi:hypothetical protein
MGQRRRRPRWQRGPLGLCQSVVDWVCRLRAASARPGGALKDWAMCVSERDREKERVRERERENTETTYGMELRSERKVDPPSPAVTKVARDK